MHPDVSAVYVIPSRFNSSHLMSSQLFSPHLISSRLVSSLPSSADHNCSLLGSSLFTTLSCQAASAHPISSQTSQISQLISTLLSSPKLKSAHLMSSHLFSHPLRSSHISSADLSSCQLVSPHLSSSQRTLKSPQLFSGPKPAPTPRQETPTLSTEKI